MATENLWGDLHSIKKVETPKSILVDQANILTKATDGLLEGRIDSDAEGDHFSHDLDVIVPSLNNYVYTLITVEHEIELYPTTVTGPDGEIECQNDEEFKTKLGEVLRSKKVRRVLSSLLSQIE